MSRNNPTMPIWRVAWRLAAAVLLAGFPAGEPLAQQPAAGVGGSARAAAPREGKAGQKADVQVSLTTHRPSKQEINIQTPRFLKMGPANNRSALPGGPGAVDRNAIGVPVVSWLFIRSS